MTKKSKAKRARQKKREPEQPLPLTAPWISQNRGMQAMILLSLVLAGFMAWQLHPTEGWGRAILWGLGFGAAIWLVFGASLAFNYWMRGRRKGDGA
ncbi:MAG: hypothetical protein KC425_11415 [Anaerolineales bacterium]|nr:hypothetical protein [Anaerolineales bacterium]